MNKENSNKGFKYGMMSLILFIIFVIFTKYMNNSTSDLYSLIIGFLTLSIGILSITGFIKSIRGIKEPNTPKKIIGMILNFGFISIFIFVLISNVLDVAKLFTE